jgi:Cof subfamily protein (haloacid dehalogenase superfamily)
MIKVFITDVDGTLYDHDNMSIPLRNIVAIQELQKRGVEVVVATARTFSSSQSIIDALDMKKQGGYVIASNGATIYDIKNDKLIYKKPIPMDLVKELYEYALANDLHFNVEQEHYVVASGYDPGIVIDSTIVGVDFYLVSPHNNYWDRVKTEPFKVSFTQEKPLIDKFYPLVDEKFKDRLYICHAGDNFIDIVLKDVNKQTAVAQLLNMLGHDFDEVAAIGDGDNDSWLLEKAGHSAAMANGTKKALAAGKITVGDCADGGLSDFVEHLLQIKI